MLKRLAGLLAILGIAAVVATAPARSQNAPAPIEWLMALQGDVVEFRPGMMILRVPPKAIVFSDRPERMVKMIDLRGFTGNAWGEGGPLIQDPPNASIITDSGRIAIVEITDALYDNDMLYLTMTLLDGGVPNVGDHVGITIDAFPTPVNNQITDA